TDVADQKGVRAMPEGLSPYGGSHVDKLIKAFEEDKDLLALQAAALNADVKGMNDAFPAASRAYERLVQGLDAWMVLEGQGAEWSRKAIKIAEVTLLVVSAYEIAKSLATSAGASSGPWIISGVLPGGVALGARVSPVTLATAIESVRKLIAIGAIDGAIVASVGKLGGGPNISIPELQRPSLSVQGPNQPAGSLSSQVKTGSTAGSAGGQKPSPAQQQGPRNPTPAMRDRIFERSKDASGTPRCEYCKKEIT